MNHTKGPWGFDGHGINGPDGERICKVCHSEPYDYPHGKAIRNERFDADSKLIAVAPELYDLFKRQDKIINSILTDSQLDIRLECGRTLREYTKSVRELLKKLEAK